MMPCKDCGAPNDDGRNLCTRCGVSLEPEGAQRLSPLPAPDPLRPAAAAVAFGEPQPVRRRLSRRASRPVIAAAGSLICSSCGKPNESSRPFCTECGFSLANAKVVREAPRWRRLLGLERARTPHPHQA